MDKHPVVVRDELIRAILVGAFLVAVFITLLLSNRPLIIGNMPNIVAGTSIPQPAARADASAVLDDYAVHVPKLRHAALVLQRFGLARDVPVDEAAPHPLAFGYSIVETDILGMPFWVRTDQGYVIYDETPYEFRAVPVLPVNIKALGISVADTTPGWQLPWWSHLWGWLFVAAVGGLGLFQLGAIRRRRQVEDMI